MLDHSTGNDYPGRGVRETPSGKRKRTVTRISFPDNNMIAVLFRPPDPFCRLYSGTVSVPFPRYPFCEKNPAG